MTDAVEVLGVSMGVGAVAGGLTGLALGIWVLADFVEPALESTSLTPFQARGITAAIALFGGLEGFVGVGVCAGAIATPVATVVGAGLAGAAYGVGSLCSSAYNSVSFFSRNNATSQISQNNEPAMVCKV